MQMDEQYGMAGVTRIPERFLGKIKPSEKKSAGMKWLWFAYKINIKSIKFNLKII